MKRSNFSQKLIVHDIRPAESGTPIGNLCRQLGIGEVTFYNKKMTYAHLGVSGFRRLRQVEEEKARLKRLVADLTVISYSAGNRVRLTLKSSAFP